MTAPRFGTEKIPTLNRLKSMPMLAAAVLMAAPAAAMARSFLATIGVTELQAAEPSLTGAGVRVGQAEANFSSSGGDAFEANPTNVGQPTSLFTYTDGNGNTTTTFNSTEESVHADIVGGYFYGTGTGVAPGVSHVDNYDANYFFGSMLFWGEPIPDAVVNQSFTFGQSNVPAMVIANQESSDTTYDNYVDEYGTIFVSGVGDGTYAYPAAAVDELQRDSRGRG